MLVGLLLYSLARLVNALVVEVVARGRLDYPELLLLGVMAALVLHPLFRVLLSLMLAVEAHIHLIVFKALAVLVGVALMPQMELQTLAEVLAQVTVLWQEQAVQALSLSAIQTHSKPQQLLHKTLPIPTQ
jgi:hypothetical protein